MKTKLIIVAIVVVSSGALPSRGGSVASNSMPARATADVTFVHPEKYTDVKVTDYNRQQSLDMLLPQLKKVIQEQAAKSLPAGERLEMKVTDIDEAGESRPAGDLQRRIVKEDYPARVTFDYTLTDASGKVVKSGHESLSRQFDESIEAQERFDSARTSVLKKMLRDWVERLAKQ